MSAQPTVVTNHVPRFIVDAYELSADERSEFDYYDWNKIEAGEDSASFIRYKGEAYDLAEFEVWDNPASLTRNGWDGIRTDSFFSGLVIRWADDSFESVVVGRYYS